MALKDRNLHILGELGALIFVIPFLLMLLNRYSFKRLDKIGIWLIIIVTLIIDGYLLVSWFMKDEGDKRKEMLKILLRQNARWSKAAEQDLNSLVAVLHANYGAGFLWAIQSVFDQDELDEVLGSKAARKEFEKRVVEIQDKATKKAVDECPQFGGAVDFLSKIAGEG